MELEQVFMLIMTYGAALYVSFGKGKGTVSMGMMLLVLSFFVLLHQMIGLSYNYVYLVSFLTYFLIAVISMTQLKEA